MTCVIFYRATLYFIDLVGFKSFKEIFPGICTSSVDNVVKGVVHENNFPRNDRTEVSPWASSDLSVAVGYGDVEVPHCTQTDAYLRVMQVAARAYWVKREKTRSHMGRPLFLALRPISGY